jgi:hypothetical protein
MFISTIASVVGIAGGVKGLLSGGGGQPQSGAQAQQAVDPFAQYRDRLGSMYFDSLQPGQQTDITQMPGYSQFNFGVMQPALQASQRQAAAAGQLYSGAEQASLQQTAQKGYYGFMTDYMNRLAQGSGATNNPAQGGMAGIGQSNANQSGFMQGLGAVGQGFAGLQSQFGGPTPTDMTGFRTNNTPWNGSGGGDTLGTGTWTPGSGGGGTLGSGTFDLSGGVY